LAELNLSGTSHAHLAKRSNGAVHASVSSGCAACCSHRSQRALSLRSALPAVRSGSSPCRPDSGRTRGRTARRAPLHATRRVLGPPQRGQSFGPDAAVPGLAPDGRELGNGGDVRSGVGRIGTEAGGAIPSASRSALACSSSAKAIDHRIGRLQALLDCGRSGAQVRRTGEQRPSQLAGRRDGRALDAILILPVLRAGVWVVNKPGLGTRPPIKQRLGVRRAETRNGEHAVAVDFRRCVDTVEASVAILPGSMTRIVGAAERKGGGGLVRAGCISSPLRSMPRLVTKASSCRGGSAWTSVRGQHNVRSLPRL
jgi:hypothetical protein